MECQRVTNGRTKEPDAVHQLFECWLATNEVPSGTTFVYEGQSVDCVYGIADGLVRLVRTDAQGRTITAGLRGRGSVLGAMIGEQHRASAIAVHRTRLHRCPVSVFQERLRTMPDFLTQAREAMMAEAAANFEDTVRPFFSDPEERLGSLLSTLVDPHARSPDRSSLALPASLDWQWLADLLHVTPEHLEQLATGWRRAGRLQQTDDALVFDLRDPPMPDTSANDGPAPAEAEAATETLDQPAGAHRPTAADQHAALALACIDRRYTDATFDLRQLSREVHVSPWHLSRQLKRSTGTGFRQCLNAKRLERARIALLSTSMSIKEIAAAVGYNHLSDLTRRFKAAHHVGPREYRLQAKRLSLYARDDSGT